MHANIYPVVPYTCAYTCTFHMAPMPHTLRINPYNVHVYNLYTSVLYFCTFLIPSVGFGDVMTSSFIPRGTRATLGAFVKKMFLMSL